MFNIDPVFFLTIMAVALPSLTIHEYAHAWTAYKFGDDTAKSMGRLTLNPIAHIDLFGTIIMPLIFQFGYAKPVPVNFSVLNRMQIFLVAVAGPLSNILVAILLALAYHTLPLRAIPYAEFFVRLGFFLNIALAVFNLIPIPPLDGSRIVYASLKSPKAIKVYNYSSRIGIFILIGLIFLSRSGKFDIFGKIMYPLIGFFSDLFNLPPLF